MTEDLTLAADASPWAREVWWSGRRRQYNVSLLIAGFAGFICYAIAVQRCIELHAPGDWEITIFTTIFQGFAYLVALGVANVCYFLGPWAERVLRPRNVATFRTTAFRLGLWFSVLFAPHAVRHSIRLLLNPSWGREKDHFGVDQSNLWPTGVIRRSHQLAPFVRQKPRSMSVIAMLCQQ